MAPLPAIYTLQASDAPQHTGRLREILQNMKTENRIGDFIVTGPEDDLSSITDNIGEDDLILIVLSKGLEEHKEQIENRFRALKSSQPETTVAEILVDNVTYDNEFLTFPNDLLPLRNRDNMDGAWNGIEESLKDMFPVKGNEEPIPWKKYAQYTVPIILIIALAWFFISGSGPEAHFSYYVGDVEQDTVTSCYPPCELLLVNESQNYDSFEWHIEDTIFTDRHLRLEFIEPGDKEILLTAFKKRKKDTFSRNLEIKTPPMADFEARNNGCTAPCTVEFINTSSGSTQYSWDFGNGLTSEENEPEVRYQSPNEYEVTLISQNSDGVTSETKNTVTIIQDDSPFADFTFSGHTGQLPREVTFTNQSQNGDSYVWQFQGGTPASSSSLNPPTVTYRSYGEFAVTLTARKTDGRNHQQVKVVHVRQGYVFPGGVTVPQNLRQLEIRVPNQNIIHQFEGLPSN